MLVWDSFKVMRKHMIFFMSTHRLLEKIDRTFVICFALPLFHLDSRPVFRSTIVLPCFPPFFPPALHLLRRSRWKSHTFDGPELPLFHLLFTLGLPCFTFSYALFKVTFCYLSFIFVPLLCFCASCPIYRVEMEFAIICAGCPKMHRMHMHV